VYKLPTNIINDDAYIGIILRKKKWKIAYVNEAYVSIKGPSNPIDYIKQRVRIIIGHKNVMRVTGTKPGTIGSMGIYNPFKIFNVFIKEISSYKMRDIPKIIVVLFLEVIAQILANIKFYNKEKYIIWEPIKSTKA
jgi:cellulose synthase/poly-beta-1,6-N-acetylglucosamine synthase-like glycosyltransferase